MRALLCLGIVATITGTLPVIAQSSSCQTDPGVIANITNTAAGVTGNYSGYSFVTISGLNLPVLPNAIRALRPGDSVPTTLLGVSAAVNWSPAFVFSYTPQQVLLLLPRLAAGCYTLYVEANGREFLETQIYLNATAPGLFTTDGQNVIASHQDWSLVTASNPAQPGDWISLWAAGLGPTNPLVLQGQLPLAATQLADRAHFSVLLNGAALDPSAIQYAGVAPGFAGLYQINIRMPNLQTGGIVTQAEIRVQTADNISPPGRFLSVR